MGRFFVYSRIDHQTAPKRRATSPEALALDMPTGYDMAGNAAHSRYREANERQHTEEMTAPGEAQTRTPPCAAKLTIRPPSLFAFALRFRAPCPALLRTAAALRPPRSRRPPDATPPIPAEVGEGVGRGCRSRDCTGYHANRISVFSFF